MDAKFKRSMVFVKAAEGGYVNHPNDPGGETNFGITKRQYPHLDIKNLTKEQAVEIYYKDYWLKFGCDKLDPPLCLVHFDAVVNGGSFRSTNWMEYIRLRRERYRRLATLRPKLAVFLKGWLNRMNNLEKFCQVWESELNAREKV